MKIGIFTSFVDMQDFYSLTSVVKPHINMIHEAGHTPVMLTRSGFSWPQAPTWLETREVVPPHTQIDYPSGKDLTVEHKMLVVEITRNLLEKARDLDVIFTHDLIFTGWHLPVNFAINNVASELGPWLHWIHSVPGGHRNYWCLPPNGMLVYPNATDRIRVAENFRTLPSKVAVIPHPCDMRDFHMLTGVARDLITRYDVLGADLVQVYPLPMDRCETKGLAEVIRLFGVLKSFGRSVRLIVPNAWCTVDHHRIKVQEMIALARRSGLTDTEVIFTSLAYPEHEVGVGRDVVADLAMCANIFICPTHSESFGLSLAEAAMSGCLLVLNEDLPMLKEVAGGARNAVWGRFSSAFAKTVHDDVKKYYSDLAILILNAFDSSPSLLSTTSYRKSYRHEAIWQRLLGAILSITTSKRAVTAL